MSPAALSRRSALFGAAALAAAPAVARPSVVPVADVDRRLAGMAADICATLDGAAYGLDPVHDEADQDLGLDGQRAAVAGYLAGGDWRLAGEFVEVESGRNADRPELANALALARLHRAPLIVAKVDRLTRSLAFLSKLLEAGVDVRFCDLPAIEGPTGRFMLQQMAAVAELEAGMISDRTRKALAAAKVRGVKLGGDRGVRLAPAASAMGRASNVRRAAARAADLAPTLEALWADGASTYTALAAGLNARGIPAARGGAWSPEQVRRVLSRSEP